MVRLGSYSEKEPQNFVLVDEDTYVAHLSSADDPKPSSYIDKETGEYPLRVQIRFKIEAASDGDEEYKNEEVTLWCGLDLNPNDKGSIWHPLQALDPDNDPEPGMDLADYYGKRCRVQVVHSDPSKNKDRKVYANVSKVLPLKKAKAPAKSAAKQNPLTRDDGDDGDE